LFYTWPNYFLLAILILNVNGLDFLSVTKTVSLGLVFQSRNYLFYYSRPTYSFSSSYLILNNIWSQLKLSTTLLWVASTFKVQHCCSSFCQTLISAFNSNVRVQFFFQFMGCTIFPPPSVTVVLKSQSFCCVALMC